MGPPNEDEPHDAWKPGFMEPENETSELRPDYESRRTRLCELLKQHEIESTVILTPGSIAYYTGNDIAADAALIGTGNDWFILSPEYDAYNFEEVAPTLEVRTYQYGQPFLSALVMALADIPAPVSVEMSGLSVGGLDQIEKSNGLRPVDCGSIMATQRAVKDPWEMARIREASLITCEVYADVSEFIGEPRRENEIAAFVYSRLIGLGSEHMASQPYVKSGQRAFLTHARWSDRLVEPTDHLFLEFGACVDRYHAPLMRTRLRADRSALYGIAVQAVVEARDAVLSAMRHGATTHDVHDAYITALGRRGVTALNRHALGYSVGLGFPPTWSEPSVFWLDGKRDGELREGMVLHVVPGLVEPKQGVEHIGLSELVAITRDGCERLVSAQDFL